jgi:hypothetical protein
MCCRWNRRRRVDNGECQDEGEDIRRFPRKRGINGSDTEVYPSKRRREFSRIAQNFIQEDEQKMIVALRPVVE